MSQEQSLDMVRWTFKADPESRIELEAYLLDHGADVHVKNEADFIVLWDEPEFDMDLVVDALWEINGEEFEITHEEFHRLSLLAYHQNTDDEDEQSEDGSDEIAEEADEELAA